MLAGLLPLDQICFSTAWIAYALWVKTLFVLLSSLFGSNRWNNTEIYVNLIQYTQELETKEIE